MWYRTFDNVVDEFFSMANSVDTFSLPKFSPTSKIKETDNGFTIKLAVPGIESKDLSVEIDDSKSEIYVEYNGEGNEFVQEFKKTYGIPQIIDSNSIEVSVELGIMVITMSRKEEASRKKIL